MDKSKQHRPESESHTTKEKHCDTESAYLDQLTFDPKLEQSFVAKYLGNIRLVILVFVVVLGMGIISFLTLPRELNPSINIAMVTVGTALPGAGPEDVESLVTVPLEDAIQTTKGVQTITSTSRDGFSSIMVEFQPGVDPDKAKSDVTSQVDTVSDLPEDATDPLVDKVDFTDTSVWTFMIKGGDDIPGMNRFTKDLVDAIEENPQIDRVETAGLISREVQVIINPAQVREKGISPRTLSQTIRSALSSYPSGSVNTQDYSFALAIDEQIEDIDDIRNTRIRIDGEMYRIGQLATIAEVAKPGNARSYQATPDKSAQEIVTLSVYKVSGSKINEVAKIAQDIVDQRVTQHKQFEAVTIIDYAKEIDDQMTSLGRNFLQTVGLVFLVMFIFLGVREATMASLSIPLAVLISFAVMDATDISISFISLFSLLLALGLLVDNAIVIVSAVNSYYKTGKFTPYQTGLLVFKDFFVALLSTNITTVWAFFPLILATGILGEFIKPIPIVVSTTIIASALVGFFLTLPFALIILKPSIPRRVTTFFSLIFLIIIAIILATVLPPSPVLLPTIVVVLIMIILVPLWSHSVGERFNTFRQKRPRLNSVVTYIPQKLNRGFVDARGITRKYRRLLTHILHSKTARYQVLTIVAIYTIVSYSLPAVGFVENEFFSDSDQEIVYVQIELPPGTNIATTEQETFRMLESLRKTPELIYVTAETGFGASAGGSGGAVGSNLIRYTLRLTDPDDRSITSIKIAEDLRNQYNDYNRGKLTVVENSDGPPAGAALQIKYLGSDLQLLQQYADNTMAYLAEIPGVTSIDKSIKSGTSKLVFVPDSNKLAEIGLTEMDVSTWLRSFASGYELDEIKIDGDDYDIVFRYDAGLENPDNLSAISIPSPSGQQYPLLSLGEIKLKTNPTVITREDGRRTISVTAAVREGYNNVKIGADLEKFADDELGMVAGYAWKTGGENEENQESLESIQKAMLLSGVLILLTLVIQLGSFRKAVIVMLVIPLAISAVLLLFGLTGIPLSFPAMIGLLALFGIVVNNSILVVEKINQNLTAGFGLRDAIIDGAASRLEPIMLTSMTTIIGLIPITMSDAVWMGLGGAIICGLAFSGVLMLFFIPVVYFMMFHKEFEQTDKKL